MDRFESMQTFVRVAEAGSFTAVAEQFQTDRSAVTRQIAALEQHLGVKLMTRSTRRLALTPEGADYLEKCRNILGLLDAAESGLTQDKAQVKGRIRLGLPLTYGLQVLMPLLIDFMRLHPDISLDMDLSDQRANLIEDALDLSIRITADLKPTDVARKLGQCSLLTLASAAYLRKRGEPLHPLELRQHDCLVYSNAGTTNNSWVYHEGKRRIQVTVRGPMVANNGVALTEAAVRGLGVTRQPDFIAAPYLARKQVRTVLCAFESSSLGVYAILPGNRYVPQRVSALVDFIVERLTAAASRNGWRG